MTREQYDYLKIGARVKLNCNYFNYLCGTIGKVLSKSIVGKEVFLAVSFHRYEYPTGSFMFVNYKIVDVLEDD